MNDRFDIRCRRSLTLVAWIALAISPIAPLYASEPTWVSTFEALSIYWKPAGGGPSVACDVTYRVSGTGSWLQAQDLWYDDSTGDATWGGTYRGSIVGLTPGAAYDVRLTLDSGPSETFVATTRSDAFPIKKTIVVGNRSTVYTTTESGSAADGYVLYDGTGSTIDVNNASNNCIKVDHSYVIIRGFTCKGAKIDGIFVNNQNNVVIEGCDVSGWGQLRKTMGDQQWGYKGDAGIDIQNSNRVVIQGNWLHHPRYDTNIRDEDPGQPLSGPTAIWMERNLAGSNNHIIRYNSVYSDPDHLFQDGMMSYGFWGAGGFPGRDSDIYGNWVSGCSDDPLENDGGGLNVRIWGNYLESGKTGVSMAPVALGPIYCFRNIIAGGLDPHGNTSPTAVKIGGEDATHKGRLYIYHNTVPGPASTGFEQFAIGGAYVSPTSQVITRNNVAVTNRLFLKEVIPGGFVNSSFDYDLFNKPSSADETHGNQAAAQWRSGHGPSSGAGGKYQLAQGSPGHNDGLVLPNFNDGFEGAGPDMGAHEYGSPDMSFGADAWLGGGGGSPEIAVNDNGVNIADGDSTPSVSERTDFGDVEVGRSVDHTFTILNTGSAALTVGTVSTGGAFSVVSQPAGSVKLGGSTRFTIRFAPTSTGVKNNSVSFSNNDANENPFNVDITGNAVPEGSAPPYAPSSLSAAAVSSSRIDLSWTDNAYSEDDFEVHRKSGAGNFETIDTVAANTTTYSDTGLSASIAYIYRVRARNANGGSAWSNESNATTYSGDYTLDASPSTVAPQGTVTVRWTAPLGGGRDWMGVYEVGTSDPAHLSWFYTGGAASGMKSVTMPSMAGDYEFRYFLSDGYSRVATSNRVTVGGASQVLAAPSGLTGIAASSSQINLALTDNSSNEDGFKIERKTRAGGFSQIDTVGANVTSYNNTNLAAGGSHTHRVRAFNSAGNSSYSNQSSATTVGGRRR